MNAHSADIRRRLARRVRYLRVERRWTQEILAERARLTAKYIGQVERGEVYPSLRVLAQLAYAFAIPLHELLRLPELQTQSREVLHTQLSSNEVHRIRDALEVLQLLFKEPLGVDKRAAVSAEHGDKDASRVRGGRKHTEESPPHAERGGRRPRRDASPKRGSDSSRN